MSSPSMDAASSGPTSRSNSGRRRASRANPDPRIAVLLGSAPGDVPRARAHRRSQTLTVAVSGDTNIRWKASPKVGTASAERPGRERPACERGRSEPPLHSRRHAHLRIRCRSCGHTFDVVQAMSDERSRSVRSAAASCARCSPRRRSRSRGRASTRPTTARSRSPAVARRRVRSRRHRGVVATARSSKKDTKESSKPEDVGRDELRSIGLEHRSGLDELQGIRARTGRRRAHDDGRDRGVRRVGVLLVPGVDRDRGRRHAVRQAVGPAGDRRGRRPPRRVHPAPRPEARVPAASRPLPGERLGDEGARA